jgi:hypothetical protein
MTIDLKRKQSTLGITGGHTPAVDIHSHPSEKAGTATEPSRSTSPQSTIIAKISENGKNGVTRPDSIVATISETGKSSQRPDSIQDYNLLKNGKSAEFQQSPLALHQVDFEIIKDLDDFGKLAKNVKVVALHQVDHDKPSTSTTLASSNAAGGNKQRGTLIYTTHAIKTTIFETTALYNQKLGGLSLPGRVNPRQNIRGIKD